MKLSMTTLLLALLAMSRGSPLYTSQSIVRYITGQSISSLNEQLAKSLTLESSSDPSNVASHELKRPRLSPSESGNFTVRKMVKDQDDSNSRSTASSSCISRCLTFGTQTFYDIFIVLNLKKVLPVHIINFARNFYAPCGCLPSFQSFFPKAPFSVATFAPQAPIYLIDAIDNRLQYLVNSRMMDAIHHEAIRMQEVRPILRLVKKERVMTGSFIKHVKEKLASLEIQKSEMDRDLQFLKKTFSVTWYMWHIVRAMSYGNNVNVLAFIRNLRYSLLMMDRNQTVNYIGLMDQVKKWSQQQVLSGLFLNSFIPIQVSSSAVHYNLLEPLRISQCLHKALYNFGGDNRDEQDIDYSETIEIPSLECIGVKVAISWADLDYAFVAMEECMTYYELNTMEQIIEFADSWLAEIVNKVSYVLNGRVQLSNRFRILLSDLQKLTSTAYLLEKIDRKLSKLPTILDISALKMNLRHTFETVQPDTGDNNGWKATKVTVIRVLEEILYEVSISEFNYRILAILTCLLDDVSFVTQTPQLRPKWSWNSDQMTEFMDYRDLWQWVGYSIHASLLEK